MGRILSELQKVGSADNIRSVSGDVNSRLKWLFESYDSGVAPREIDWTKVIKPIRRDPELWEREFGTDRIINYVADLYKDS